MINQRAEEVQAQYVRFACRASEFTQWFYFPKDCIQLPLVRLPALPRKCAYRVLFYDEKLTVDHGKEFAVNIDPIERCRLIDGTRRIGVGT